MNTINLFIIVSSIILIIFVSIKLINSYLCKERFYEIMVSDKPLSESGVVKTTSEIDEESKAAEKKKSETDAGKSKEAIRVESAPLPKKEQKPLDELSTERRIESTESPIISDTAIVPVSSTKVPIDTFVMPNISHKKIVIQMDNPEFNGVYEINYDDNIYKIQYDRINTGVINYTKIPHLIYDKKDDDPNLNSDSNNYQWKLILINKREGTIQDIYIYSPELDFINPESYYITRISDIISYSNIEPFSDDNSYIGWFDKYLRLTNIKLADFVLSDVEVTTSSQNTSTNEVCNYVPIGRTRQDCINRCNSSYESFFSINNGCNADKCERICNTCDDKKNCKWISTFDGRLFEKKLPPKLTVVGIPGNGNVELQWRCKENQLAPVKEYIINYFKTYVQSEGVNTRVVSRFNNLKNNKEVIENLENGTSYSFSVYSKNNFGVGEQSDIITLVPSQNNKLVI